MPEPSKSLPPLKDQSLLVRIFIDWRFQLKYAGLLASVALILCGALGMIVWAMSLELVEQSERAVQAVDEAVSQGRESAERAKSAVVQRQRGSDVLLMYMLEHYGEDEGLSQRFLKDDTADAKVLEREHDRSEREATSLALRAVSVEQQAVEVAGTRQQLLVALLAVLFVLVVAIGIAGIVFARRIAGPVATMKRLLAEIGAGQLAIHDRLSPSDEHHDLFDALEGAARELRERRAGELAKLDAMVSELRSARNMKELQGSVDRLAQLRKDLGIGVDP